MIPALANLCPLAWGLGVDIHVQELDETFADALPDIRRGYNELYPEWGFHGDVIAENDVETDSETGENSMLLFTGGVDSVASYVRTRKEDPILTTVYFDGWATDEEIENVRSWVGTFAEHEGVRTVGIESNLREVFDNDALRDRFGSILSEGWWPDVQYRFALLGLCAPTAVVNDVGELHIAASFTDGYNDEWGTYPNIDEQVEWSGTTVTHCGDDLTRQQKLHRLADFHEEEYKHVPVRACWRSDDGHNCGRCEKCCRTIVGLELAGLDAEKHGFEVSPDLFERIRSGLRVGGWSITAAEEFFWTDLQRHADPTREYDRAGMNEFVEWLQDVDMAELREQSESLYTIQGQAGKYLDRMPGPVRETSKRIGKPLLIFMLRRL